ncbi:hypothetical protein QBC34DRAFT_31893 [Podospora aff. communis PSN243]|uniref:Uncharacterized protein n=1 Tax=Podospora aff. communis PSN243 TaxID=3040156 RepID=A0AAV9GTQ2_9PEZI|nr:hypothetical protein QBC34DRAFT_31893 [Podospora aff. communis PSN243]
MAAAVPLSGTASVFRTPYAPPGDRARQVLLRQGVDIALDYFNIGEKDEIPRLTSRAEKWCRRYYQGYDYYGTSRPLELLDRFPGIFNLRIEPHLRLDRSMPSSPAPSDHSEMESMESKGFPAYSEPTLASKEELDQITEVRPRATHQVGMKPVMRVDATMLRGSGLMDTLPEFLGQLARANLETETKLAENAEGSGFELDDETAANQPHISFDIFAGLIKRQKRKRSGDIVLPGSTHSEGSPSSSSSSGRSRIIKLKPPGRSRNESSPESSRPSTSSSEGLVSEVDEQPRKKIKIVLKTSRSPTPSGEPSVPPPGSSGTSTSKRPTKIKIVNRSSSSSSAGSPSPTTVRAPGSFISGVETPPARKTRIVVVNSSSRSSSSPSGSPSPAPLRIKIVNSTSRASPTTKSE